jgi:hypothetical protein
MSVARSVVVVLCVSVVLGLAAPAYAETRTIRDPARDVVLYDNSDEVTAAPDRTDGDIRRVRIGYSDDKISGVIKYADLQPPDRRMIIDVGLRWGHDPNNIGALTVTASKRRPTGVGHFVLPSEDCSVRHEIDYARNLLRFSVSSSCVDNSPWVRANALTLVRAAPHSGSAWFDSAPKKFGPRIHRG